MGIAIGVGVGVVFGAAAGVAPAAWTPADWGATLLRWYTASDVVLDGSYVTTWTDQVGSAHATQSTQANQGVVATIGSADAVLFANGDYYIIPSLTTTGTAHTTFAVQNNQSIAGTQNMTVFLAPSNWATRVSFGSGGQASIWDGSDKSFGVGTSTTGEQAVAYVTSGTNCVYWRDGVNVANVNHTARQIQGAGTIAFSTASSDLENCELAELLWYDGAADSTALTHWFDWAATEYVI